jgi:hypothetical protein
VRRCAAVATSHFNFNLPPQGLAAVTAGDWVRDAEARLAADDAIRALRSHVALLNQSLARGDSIAAATASA